MPIQRYGPTPEFVEYAKKYCIVTRTADESSWPDAVAKFKPKPIEIPTFQRKIVWRKNDINELIDSDSAMFGTVIMAEYHGERPYTLIDGLQRFATATAMLFYLFPLVLSEHATDKTTASYFKRLPSYVNPFFSIISHNDNILKRHTRGAIRESYVELSEEIQSIVKERIVEQQSFAESIERMFLDKLIAIDEYSGFTDRRDITNTFINMNSTGIVLTEVDLLRAELVDQAEHKSWSVSEIEDMENAFSDTFESGSQQVQVLGKAIYDGISTDPEIIFPKWQAFNKKQFVDLIEFIEETVLACKDSTSWPYLAEIYHCGGLPFAITFLYFYIVHKLEGEVPDFVGGSLDTNYKCRTLLRAFYRKLIDGTIGRTGPTAKSLATGKVKDLDKIVESVNPEKSAGSLSDEPKKDWLILALRTADSKRSRSIFNACKLPEKSDLKSSFSPLIFGKKQDQWVIDHLIPKSSLVKDKKGSREGNLLPNFAPLRNNLNITVQALTLKQKLAPGGGYDTVINEHQFIDWLVNTHSKNHVSDKEITQNGDKIHPFNAQSLLEMNTNPPIGDERITKIAELLKKRL